MKKLILLFVLIISVACSTDDDNEKIYRSTGVIEGVDNGKCLCCGGYIIIIDEKRYLAPDELPNKENLDLENLPIKVKLDWELKNEDCDNHITVLA